MKDYSIYKIKDYKFWALQIHENQGYLGRCVVWCKRQDALELTGATKEEMEELIIILKDLKKAHLKAFSPDWFNYAFLGNEAKHLHCHVVPRYEKPREFMGITFEDKLFGHNYKTDHSFTTSDEVLFAIRDKIKEVLG